VTYKLRELLNINEKNKKVDLMETCLHLHKRKTLGINQAFKEDRRKERSTLHVEKKKKCL
jgi:hypothetical protein